MVFNKNYTILQWKCNSPPKGNESSPHHTKLTYFSGFCNIDSVRHAITQKEICAEKTKDGYLQLSCITYTGKIFTMKFQGYPKKVAIRRFQHYVTEQGS